MSLHLKLARLKIEAACKMKPTDEHAVKLEEMLYCLLLHLEAQQETPASETSSAPTTGPVVKRYGSAIASLATSPGRYHLTVETGDSSKSISFTSEEWAAIRQHFSVPWSTSVSPTAFIGKPAAGGRGVAVPDSPASSPEPAQEGNEETHIHRHEVRRIEDMERRLEILEAQPTRVQDAGNACDAMEQGNRQAHRRSRPRRLLQMNAKDEGQQDEVTTSANERQYFVIRYSSGPWHRLFINQQFVGDCKCEDGNHFPRDWTWPPALNALQQQVTELEGRLKKYGQHARGCNTGDPFYGLPCSCGLEAPLTSPSTIAQRPPEGLTPEEEIAWAESLPNAAGGAYTQEMTEAYTRAQFESSTIAQEEQR